MELESQILKLVDNCHLKGYVFRWTFQEINKPRPFCMDKKFCILS